MLGEEQKQETILRQHEQFRNKIRYTVLVSGLGIFLLLTFLLWRNIQHKKRSNTLLQNEKQKVEKTLEELKSTQAQLIQSEKMASLGQLTAGIAHEIQNPLNFVNNFSDVNKELIEEVKNEKIKDKSKRNDELEMQLLGDIEKNLEKISHYGKRADAIVKGMLQHSRSSSGQKEPTDINALCDEYLRLAYHGFRAKDKSFNTEIKTGFDHSIRKIDIVPQEIGRVILNLISNAFYAVNEKAKENVQGYEPIVIVTTKTAGDKTGSYRVFISVADNGNGIPKNIIDRIFQPFFTTKPAGQGTGLGLSLAYDIVKSHGGEINVESKENEGSTFTIQLSVS
jgi:signal transduction histidine kinase